MVASITTSFAQLPKSLEVLQINQITSTESERLCDYFIKSPKLKRLELGQMKSNHQGIKNVFKSLLNLQDLTHFTAYLGYPEFVYADLKRFLQLNNHLVSLTISEPHLRCLKSFNNSLISHQRLKKLNVEFIAIDTDAMICLTQLLINSKVLKQLYIKVIPDNPTLNDFGVLNITQGLNNLPSTQSIPNHPSTDLMPSLLDGLSLNTTISYVSINSNLIETTDSWILDKALSNINRINPNFMLNNQNIFDYDTELRIFMNRQAKHLLQVSRYLLLLESIVRRDVMYLIQEFFILPYFSIDRLLLRNVLLQRSSIGELLQIEYDSFDCSELIRFSSIWNTNKV
ncbi:hypothetical protein BC833DRAFT_575706 [Globomyces pollinis-pini]|nr:hypothetical protein BC833DRAFT_575706 [Globomyces pollinis-pini]